MAQLQGTRKPDNTKHTDMEIGDYCKCTWTSEVFWMFRDPIGKIGSIYNNVHNIVENEDGTITVTPSIAVKDAIPHRDWHGYLTKGIWIDC